MAAGGVHVETLPGKAAIRDAAAVIHVLAGAIGVWLGIHAVRSYLMMVVWNVAEDASASQMGLTASAVWLAGLLGFIPAWLLGRANAVWRLGILFAALTVARQAFPGEVTSPAFAFASVVAWLWWLAAYLRLLVDRGRASLAVPAIVLGLLVQSSVQMALHGIDVHVVTGDGGMILGVLTAAFFVATLRGVLIRPSRSVEPDAVQPAGGIWGLVAAGPFLFIQLTLLTNLGRLQVFSGLAELPVALAVQVSLLAALLTAYWSPRHPIRLALGLLSIVLLALVPSLTGWAMLVLIPTQVGLTANLAATFSGHARRGFSGAFAGGMLAFFVLLFVYYANNYFPILWSLGATIVVLAAGRARRGVALRDRGLAAAGLAIAALGIVASLIPSASFLPAAGPAPAQLTVFNYNVHQSLDAWSVPSVQALGDLLSSSDADIITLQEVPRGSNLSGGIDVLGYLRWRLPQYNVVDGHMPWAIYGNAILSKYPISEGGWRAYPVGRGQTPRGLVWAVIPSQAGDLLVTATHLTSYEGYDADRKREVAELIGFVGGRKPAIHAGDYNANPDGETIRRMVAAGFRDTTAVSELAETPTHSSIRPADRFDYVFASADLTPLSAAIPATTVSDHLPVVVTVRLR